MYLCIVNLLRILIAVPVIILLTIFDTYLEEVNFFKILIYG